jgi:hypothetical protein
MLAHGMGHPASAFAFLGVLSGSNDSILNAEVVEVRRFSELAFMFNLQC